MTQSTRNKVPGPMHAHKESYVENLATYTIVQLIEIRNRQAKLLENKYVSVSRTRIVHQITEFMKTKQQIVDRAWPSCRIAANE